MKLLKFTTGILLMLGIAFGAFGAHALKNILDSYQTSIYEKAVFYHLFHALGLLVLVLNSNKHKLICLFLIAGIVFFSGSLYLLAITGQKWLGMITPIGGTCFIIAWLLFAINSLKSKD